MKKTIFLFAILGILQGCSTLADARNAKGQGTVKVYKAPIAVAWKTVVETLKELELPLAGENKEEGYILAQKGMSFGSYGENVAIFLESAKEKDSTKVEVISKKAMATNIFATNWEEKIIQKLDEKIK